MLDCFPQEISFRKLLYIVVPLFGAAYAAPNKGITILYCFRSPKPVLNPPVNGKIQGLFKAFCVFQVLFKAN